jgi:hypothetical protein
LSIFNLMRMTYSEKLFREYLENKGLILNQDFFYEPDLGKARKIDFFVRTNNALFEVTEFNKNNIQDKQLLKTLDSKEAMIFDSYSLIRNKIDDKRDQFKAYKDDYICVLVLHQGDSMVASLETELLAGAIFGDISMRYSNEGNHLSTFFGRNGSLKPSINTTFSAIAVIQESFTERKIAFSEFWKTSKKDNLTNLSICELEKVFENWNRAARYDLDKRTVSLRVILNPYAKNNMLPNFFNSELDEVFSIDPSGRFSQQK